MGQSVEAVEAAALGAADNVPAAFGPLGDDIDHAPDGVGAPQRTLRPAQNLDARNAGIEQVLELELRGAGRVVDLDAVDQHQGLVALGAADADLGQAADAARAIDGDAGDVAQHVGDHPALAVLELVLC